MSCQRYHEECEDDGESTADPAADKALAEIAAARARFEQRMKTIDRLETILVVLVVALAVIVVLAR